MKLEDLIRHKKEACQTILSRFEATFAKEPLRALHWSGDAFEAAAGLQLWTELEAEVTQNGRSLEALIAHLTAQVLQKAEYPSHSTSPTANLAEEATKRQTAAALRELKRLGGAK